MAEASVYKNVVLCKFYNQTGAVTTVTSVLGVSVTDNTAFIKSGSDNDTRPTFTQQGANECTGDIRLRDPLPANNLANQTGILVFVCQNQKTGGVNSVREINPVTFGQFSGSQNWQELGEVSLRFEGGSITHTTS